MPLTSPVMSVGLALFLGSAAVLQAVPLKPSPKTNIEGIVGRWVWTGKVAFTFLDEELEPNRWGMGPRYWLIVKVTSPIEDKLRKGISNRCRIFPRVSRAISSMAKLDEEEMFLILPSKKQIASLMMGSKISISDYSVGGHDMHVFIQHGGVKIDGKAVLAAANEEDDEQDHPWRQVDPFEEQQAEVERQERRR